MKVKNLVLAVSIFVLLLAAQTTAQAQTWQYTALGDSLAYGMNDSQGGYAARFRNHVQTDTGATVNLINRGVPGWTSADLLNALRTDEGLRAQIANSQIVTFDIGGNDMLDALNRYSTGTCGGADNQDCVRSTVANFKANWNAIISQLLSLRSPSNTVIRTMDIYNPAVNLERFYGVFSILKPYLDDINRHVFLTAVSNRIACARVYQAFNGVNGELDAGARGYMSSDGVHPNDTGHQIIAGEFRALSYQPLVTPQSTIQLVLPVTVVNENAGRATVVVSRSGNTSGEASVEYSTVDNPAAVPCADAPAADGSTGTAYARCDYATTVDTLRFAAGETQKSFTVPVINDAHVENTEEFPIRIDNPVGASLGTRTTADVRITDDELRFDPPVVPPNPIRSSDFFVRMQYLDFLSREPDTGGFNAWMSVLNGCSNVNDNPACDRLTVSSSFFRSQEFQLKGYLVYLFYKVSLGRLPLYAEIIPDMRRVTGATAEEVFAKRLAFANAWVERQEFKDRFPDTLTPAAFVDKLLDATGVTLGGSVTRASLTSDLQTRRKTRAEALMAVVEHPAVFAKEYNSAFVAMQYFGYLRRDPDADGFNAWLNYLNAHPDDFRTMVNGFANSREYQLRFGQAQ
ncbi:MAG TPA: GDSL-type esterase/lipase family protein [Pyrinomonadaceae bacterium]|nr:GDSL-type esterase/lipase family protein [Pyrinomonadaceae bacterium]